MKKIRISINDIDDESMYLINKDIKIEEYFVSLKLRTPQYIPARIKKYMKCASLILFYFPEYKDVVMIKMPEPVEVINEAEILLANIKRPELVVDVLKEICHDMELINCKGVRLTVIEEQLGKLSGWFDMEFCEIDFRLSGNKPQNDIIVCHLKNMSLNNREIR